MADPKTDALIGLARELSQAALDALPPAEFWRLMARRLETVFDAERASIFQVSPKSGRLISRYAEGVIGSVILEKGQGIAGRAAETLEPYVTNAPYNDPRFSAAMDAQLGYKTRNLLAFPLTFHGEAVGVVELINKTDGFKDEDVADVRRLAQHLSVLFVGMRLQEQQEEIQAQLIQGEKMAALGRMAGGLAHEINNPVASVLGFVELMMRDERTPSHMLPTLLKVDAEGRRIAAIVKNVLGLSRAPSGKAVPVRLSVVVKESLELVAHEARRRRVTFTQDFAPGEPEVLGDAGSFKQVFINLIMNALQALDAKGEPGRIFLSTSVEDGRVVARVVDDGPGVPRELQDRLFEPFFTTKEAGKGTGLGLYVIKRIVELHGGTLTFTSQPGRGAAFAVSLPVRAQ